MTSDELKTRIVKTGFATAECIQGCTSQEIRRIEKHIGRSLPEPYKEIMKAIGRGAGEFMSDLKMFFPDVLNLTKTTREALSADYGFDLPADAFVFVTRFDGQTLYLCLNEGPDPSVYKWDTREHKLFDSIWDFIEDEVRGAEYCSGVERDC